MSVYTICTIFNTSGFGVAPEADGLAISMTSTSQSELNGLVVRSKRIVDVAGSQEQRYCCNCSLLLSTNDCCLVVI